MALAPSGGLVLPRAGVRAGVALARWNNGLDPYRHRRLQPIHNDLSVGDQRHCFQLNMTCFVPRWWPIDSEGSAPLQIRSVTAI